MKFELLITTIEKTNNTLQKRALSSVNQLLVIRNWLIGYYLVEFEQKGEDRAKYGKKLLETIESELKKKKIKGMSLTNLRLFRLFYNTYPQIHQPVADILKSQIQQPVADELLSKKNQLLTEGLKPGKSQSLANFTDKDTNIQIPPIKLLQNFSFRHFTELIKIKTPLKRVFYEQQAIKGNWSARQLKRQIESLLLERIGLSNDKNALLKSIQNNQAIEQIEDTIKDPYILEFTGFKELPAYSEKDLETALLNKIQDFLIELGNGFCFEARQKRITIGKEHDRIDLVFYHRILKCHVLIDLKTKAFSHADVGQMNFYLNYYRKNIMEKKDNLPVGIILCTDKDETKVEYAIAGLDNKLFISKYLIELPSKNDLLKLLKDL